MQKIIIGATLLALSACDSAPSVEVDGESLNGMYVEDGKVAAFLGVPFAEPPVGNLRWRAPQPLSSKVADRDASKFEAACMQSMRILDWYRSMAVQFGGSADYYEDLAVSEDCLYLNVWTPTLETDAKLPVMVWIHGGSNKSGWAYEPNYYGHKLAQENVVVISVAYRQGVFGFFSHSDMPAEEPVANFAYWDLVASLQWIQDNIEEFGGDPDRVTLFGESAGAQNILALMFAEPATDLFHRGALQSTAGFGRDRMSSLEAEQQRATELARVLDLSPDGSLQALKQVPADELFAAYDAAFSNYYHSPAVDGQMFIERTWAAMQEHGFGARRMIIGTNRDEWYSSTAEDTSWSDVEEKAAEDFSGSNVVAAMDIIREESDPRRALDRLRTAASMLCEAQQVAATMNASGSDAWMYHFTRVREDEAGAALGAYHGAEYPYVFGTHDDYMTSSDTDLALEEVMQSYWVEFATSGNPNSDETTNWPRFEAPELLVQELGDTVMTVSAPEPELCALFESEL